MEAQALPGPNTRAPRVRLNPRGIVLSPWGSVCGGFLQRGPYINSAQTGGLEFGQRMSARLALSSHSLTLQCLQFGCDRCQNKKTTVVQGMQWCHGLLGPPAACGGLFRMTLMTHIVTAKRPVQVATGKLLPLTNKCNGGKQEGQEPQGRVDTTGY